MEPSKKYRVFNRTWWKRNPAWPDGREPHAGTRRYHKGRAFATEAEARVYCQEWNATHKPGKLSNKCEFESI